MLEFSLKVRPIHEFLYDSGHTEMMIIVKAVGFYILYPEFCILEFLIFEP
jgi:hypothetical protein